MVLEGNDTIKVHLQNATPGSHSAAVLSPWHSEITSVIWLKNWWDD